MNLKEYLDGISVPSGSSKRSDCPVCGGSNSFSVTNHNGTLIYNCYKASCSAHGATAGLYTSEDASREVSRLLHGEHRQKEQTFVIPSYFKPIEGYGEKYLDVKENRNVYIVRDSTGKAVDAVGRTNVKGVRPKWKRYGNSQHPYVAGPWNGIAVIVEDCISAEAVRKTGEYTGIGLLGTQIGSGVHTVISHFDGIIFALDFDASSKAVDFYAKYNWVVPTTVCLLKEDLKYFRPEEIKEQLKEAREYLNEVGNG